MTEYHQETNKNISSTEQEILEKTPPPPPQPVRVEIKTAARQPIVTYGLIGLMVLLFLGQLASEQIVGYDVVGFWGMKINELMEAGQVWRFFTPMFLHGSISHILFNLYALYQIGRILELQYGHARFLALFLVTGFTGVVFSFAFSTYPSLGSSTAIFGLLAAYGVFAWQNQDVFGKRATSTFYNVAFLAVVNFMLGLSPGIDNWGHLGGFVGGLAISWFGGVKYVVEGIRPDLKVVNARTSLDFYRIASAVFAVFLLASAVLLVV